MTLKTGCGQIPAEWREIYQHEGNIENEGLAKVQDPHDPKNRGWASHPAFSFPSTFSYFWGYCEVCL